MQNKTWRKIKWVKLDSRERKKRVEENGGRLIVLESKCINIKPEKEYNIN